MLEFRDRHRDRAARRRFVRDRRGTTAIEFAILAVPFFLLIFAVLETAAVFIGEMTLENATAQVGRQVRTGEVADAQVSAPDLRQRICATMAIPIDCEKLQIDLREYERYSDISSAAPVKNNVIDVDGLAYDEGEPGRIMALRAFYEWPIHTDIIRRFLSNTPSGNHMLVAVDVFKTEPFQ
ncbi:hypothetical protein NS365_17735 [Aureimonas ureilytica]|uniref:TadE-like domain-containing protein n=1 Tax=Aureimonas ureilytica TaxID=401562 RepID=A0A175RIW5_9HYPH|nr:TadE/TadG family type IV pilus assembly protein [Aureimonas ureilytica]KTR03707.1 hypothetical protein NS365_17735 [Aureimonas ureilytica]